MAAWFIFRQPHQDVFQDSSIAVLLFPEYLSGSLSFFPSFSLCLSLARPLIICILHGCEGPSLSLSLPLALPPSLPPFRLQDEVTWSKLQRRLLHVLSQAAEKEMSSLADPEMPPLQAGDAFHPATKIPSCKKTAVLTLLSLLCCNRQHCSQPHCRRIAGMAGFFEEIVNLGRRWR